MTTHLCIHGEMFSRTQDLVDWIASGTGWPVLTDRDLVEAASRRFDMPADRLEHFLMTPDGVRNRLTHGTEKAMARVQAVMVDKLAAPTTIFHGSLALPTTRQLPETLNVLVTAPTQFRVQRARRTKAMNENSARAIIRQFDRQEFEWCRAAFGDDRFDANAYDLVIPSDRLDTETAGRMILDAMMRTEMRSGKKTAQRLADLKLASTVLVHLSEGGYHVSAAARSGCVRLTINHPVVFLNRLARKLESQVLQVKGVQQVEIRAGRYFFQADIYRRCRFELSSEAAFANYIRCHRNLHDSAAAQVPSTVNRPTRKDRIRAVQHLASVASP